MAGPRPCRQPSAVSDFRAPPQPRPRHLWPSPRLHPDSRLFEIGLVDIAADELADAEPRAGDGGAAEAVEGIHHALNPPEPMQLEALLGEFRREGRRVRPIAVAPLNRLVGDEPGVAAAPDAIRRL